MALEDLVGSKYINDFNPSWPAGTDLPDAGDDHIRGIKNVLQRSFPQISGPVSRDHTSLSRGSVPVGSVLPFYQAAAPTGWERTAGLSATSMIRIVPSATAGGTSGGSHDPVYNDKVPSHNHGTTYSGNGFIISMISSSGSEAGLAGGTNAWVRSEPNTANNASATIWQPRYMDMILCQRTS